MALIEAALYITGRPLDLKTLGSIAKIKSEEKVRELARSLIERYRRYGGSIDLLELEDGRFVMQLKPEYVKDVKRLSTKRLLTPGPLKTLSFIAVKQPVTQAYVVKIRGKPAYQHIRQLENMDLITEEKLGRTKILRTTKTFADYFNLSHEIKTMKKQLQNLFESLNSAK
jgi:segregation and condensation protein B